MKSFAVWDDIEIYTDTIGFVVTSQLAQIEVEYFDSCDEMFHQTSVTKHKVSWERELTTFSLKDKRILEEDFSIFCLFCCCCFFVCFVLLLVFGC